MKKLIIFFKGFKDRKGNYVFMATVIARILSFLASIIALKLIDKTDLGYVIYALNIMAFIIPLSGLGIQQGLLRFGARLKSTSEKKALFSFVFKKGILFSTILAAVIFVISYILPLEFTQSAYFLRWLSALLLSSFLLESIKIQFRLEHNNKKFAFIEIFYNVLLVIIVFILSYFFKETGYTIALVATPLITFLWFFKSLNIRFKSVTLPIPIDFTFLKYGFFAGLANVATQLLFAIDILLIGSLLNNPSLVTAYKYVFLIPFSLLFLPGVLLTTDFVNLTERIYDKAYINSYSKNYRVFFLLFSIGISAIFYPFSKSILALFAPEYQIYSTTFLVLTGGVFGILIFRGLYGNLLSALGKAHINYWIAFVALLINIPANYYLIPKYGILGAAITSASLMWLSSLSTWIVFKILHNKALK
ncbi:MAG: polysaccharide biosynthesis C-terminal domain-containing protein [Flavobacteriaceae bacterium]|nr:polysaccharide biosynthesis C-terminal domain-containing protein [Flavobacteriaceae bacterium]